MENPLPEKIKLLESEPTKFSLDKAIELVIAAVQAGSIKLSSCEAPLPAQIRNEAIRAAQDLKHEGKYQEANQLFQMASNNQLIKTFGHAAMARSDALYILTLIEALRTGLTKEESERIVTFMTNCVS